MVSTANYKTQDMVKGAIAIAVLGVLASFVLQWDAVALTVSLQELTSRLGPLAFAAAVIERAVEILISPWRDAEASKLSQAVTSLQPGAANPSPDPAALKAASDALAEYRGETQRIAFSVSLTLASIASLVGVRALGSFADLSTASRGQHLAFRAVDVALSAALLAGGADGIHSIVSAVTGFFDATAAKTNP